MASKRILGVLTVKNGRLVKSYGYAAWRPAGDLITALRNLDRWAADEIVVLDVSRRAAPDPAVLRQIGAARVSTPLAYGGGIRRAEDLARLMDLGCDRFVVESLLFDDPAALHRLAEVAGEQALIGSVPLQPAGTGWSVWRPGPAALVGHVEALVARLASLPVSEYLVTAVASEGRAGIFPAALPAALAGLPSRSVIWFGGLDAASAVACLRAPVTAAVAFGNPLHETELALPRFRAALRGELGSETVRAVRTLAA